jgi:3-deoxy-D-manno-octulosonic-acid transferase
MTLYEIFTFIVYYIAFPFLYLLYRTGSYKWGQRLGFYRNGNSTRKNDLWLHASSMGEVKVLSIIVRELRKLNDALQLHITVMTETGYGRARELFSDYAEVSYLPLDYSSSIKRFLNTINPTGAVFIETEIWPNMVHELGRRGIPIFLANGRLSESSGRRYQWFKSGLRKIFSYYNILMVQSETDKTRYTEIGAAPDRMKVIGSLKFDAPVKILSTEKKASIKKKLPFKKSARLFIAGSTRIGEEELILDTYKKLLTDFENLRLILAPRHLHRLDDVRKIIENHRLPYVCYSEIRGHAKDVNILLIDKMGILNNLYAVSDIAFVGGTLVDIGGQNILEPVWVGVPVLYGLSIFNVKDSSEYILNGKYGAMVQNNNELYTKLQLFLRGAETYNIKHPDDSEPTRALQTARIILEGLNKNANSLAENNNQ